MPLVERLTFTILDVERRVVQVSNADGAPLARFVRGADGYWFAPYRATLFSPAALQELARYAAHLQDTLRPSG